MPLLRLPQGELSDALVALRRVFTVIGGFSLAISTVSCEMSWQRVGCA